MGNELRFPRFVLMGAGSVFFGIALWVRATHQGHLAALTCEQRKWVFLRGLIGTTCMCLTLTSIAAGAPVGDVAALGSTNVVVAAVFAHVFLGEKVRSAHVCA